ncbi:hypothetical protein [Xylella fastidiosa]|uniref:hypothetical protein n=1 Tax=Xylella fastidiosa TaxID=2371 RepID=UPI001E4FD0B5|nr:hypothetical protein [Xylella fastidiosa]
MYISTSVFAVALAAIFFVWYRVERTLSIHDIVTRSRELFYWAAILCTFALDTTAAVRHWVWASLGVSLLSPR